MCSLNKAWASSMGGQETVLVKFVWVLWGRGSIALGLRQAWLEGLGHGLRSLGRECQCPAGSCRLLFVVGVGKESGANHLLRSWRSPSEFQEL